MRCVSKHERKQRGCDYCKDGGRRRAVLIDRPGWADRGEHLVYCTHDVCPYHELDSITNYITEYDRVINRGLLRVLEGVSGAKKKGGMNDEM